MGNFRCSLVGIAKTLFFLHAMNLNSSSGDEEPLVNGAINRSRGEILAPGDAGDLRGVGKVGGFKGRSGTALRLAFRFLSIKRG